MLDALPFLDRTGELAAMREALVRARGGAGSLLLIGGEAGIGKTRLVTELAAPARESEPPGPELKVAWGRCWDSGGAPTMWPWIAVIRTLIAGRDPDELRVDLGVGAPWLAQVVPELRDSLPELGDELELDSEQSRFVLFDALASFLRRSADRQPLVVVLDDMHAADQLSLLALLFLARQIADMRVLAIATHREAEIHRTPRVEEQFSKLFRVGQRIALSGLDAGDVGRLIELRNGDPETAQSVHRATGGNPFYADEVVRMLVTETAPERESAANVVPLPVPMGVRTLIEQRLEALPEATLRAVRQAAVIGAQFSLLTLAAVTGEPRGELLEMLEPALQDNVIAVSQDHVARFHFVHDLFRETANAGLSRSERARIHAAVGDALVGRATDNADSSVEEIAHHYLEALPVGDPQPAVDYAQRAADHAAAAFAHERAARLYTAGLDALELLDELDPSQRAARRCALLLGRGRAQLRIADPGARETLLDAAAAARTAGSVQSLAEIAIAFGAYGLSPGVVDEELVGLLEEALDSISEEDSPLRANLLARLARALYWSDETAVRRTLIDDAIAVARRVNDPLALGRVLGDCITASRGPDTAELELKWIDELLSLPQPLGDAVVIARSNEIDLLLERGALSAADAAIDSLERHVARLQDARAYPYIPLHRARRALMDGRWEEAERHLQAASEIAIDIEDSTFPMVIGGGFVVLRINQGRAAELHAQLRLLAESLPRMPVWRAALANVHAQLSEDREAELLLERLSAEEFGRIPRNVMWPITVAGLAEVCAALGDRVRAERLYGLMLPFAEHTVISPVVGFRGPMSRYLGLLAATIGDRSAAEAHLRAALELARQQRTAPTVARIALDLAAVLADRTDGSAGEALELLDEAAELAGPLALEQVIERVEQIRQELHQVPRPSLAPVPLEPPPPIEPGAAGLSRAGELWSVQFEGRVVRLRDSKGLRYLAELLANPSVEVHSLQLVRGAEPAEAPARVTAGADELSLADPHAGAGAALDAAAKAAYRRRLEDLREELEEAERFNDPERAARAREEIDFIGHELAAAVGLGGRDRVQSSDAERARVNVTRAIKSTIRRLRELDAGLGVELQATVHTGLFCRYEPDLRRPLRWEVDVPR
jgi:tetratricopeptide (TPR) repeat protein